MIMDLSKRITWIDVLSIAGFLAALYVIYVLVDKAQWGAMSLGDVPLAIVAICVGIVSLVIGGGALAAVLRSTGDARTFALAPSVIASNRTVLSKYLPGKIWYVVGIAESLYGAGVDRGRAWVVVVIYQVILIVSALLLGLLAIVLLGMLQPLWNTMPWNHVHVQVGLGLLLLLAMWAGCRYAVRFNAMRKMRGINYHWLVIGLLIAGVHWLIQGVAIWILLSVFHGQWLDSITVLIVPGIYALGFIVLIAPGGMGVREVLFMQYFVHVGISLEGAAGLAIAARLSSLLIEAGAWSLLHAIPRRSWPDRVIRQRSEVDES